MSGKKSSSKGYRGETDSLKHIQSVIYPEGDGQCLRTPGSGTWGGMVVMTGDVVMVYRDNIDIRFPYYWQVKFHAPSAFPTMWWMVGYPTILEKWMAEIDKKGLGDKFIPLIMWRTTFMPWFITMKKSDFEVQLEWFGPVPLSWTRVANPGRKTEARHWTGQAILSNITKASNSENGIEEQGLVTMPFGLWAEWLQREVFCGEGR